MYGALALNQHVGGLNPAAVAAALAIGARVIWMPTTDCHTQEAAGLPRLCRAMPRLPNTTYAIPPVDRSTEASVRQIVDLIAEADAVLATGHLSTAETAWLLPVARAAGVRRLLITHPGYTVPAMSATEAAELTAARRVRRDHRVSAPAPARLLGVRAGRLRPQLSGPTESCCPPTPGSPTARLRRRPCPSCWSRWCGEGLDRGALTACASELPDRLVTPA